jgi:PadR family transcriptional regulator, regulatory protein PadR
MADREALKGHLELLLLGALRDEPAHGYAVIARIRYKTLGEFDLAEGTVYPVLHKLESQKMLKSAWDESAGRRRRVYHNTRRGPQTRSARQKDWATLSRGVEAVLAWA